MLAIRLAVERRSSGSVLLDIGPNPMSKMQTIVLAVTAVVMAVSNESRAQAFAYATWSMWSILMGRGCKFGKRAS